MHSSSDFLSNLLVLLLRVMNVGLSDSGLLTHLSEATAGSLNGIGHSKAYEELATYSLSIIIRRFVPIPDLTTSDGKKKWV
jgi:hypothetical protein